MSQENVGRRLKGECMLILIIVLVLAAFGFVLRKKIGKKLESLLDYCSDNCEDCSELPCCTKATKLVKTKKKRTKKQHIEAIRKAIEEDVNAFDSLYLETKNRIKSSKKKTKTKKPAKKGKK